MVPAPDRAAVRRDHRRPLPLPQARHLRHLDPGDHAGQGDGAGDGHSGAVGLYRRLCHRCRNGGRQRGAVRALDRHQPRHGTRLGSQGLYRRRGRRHGQPRRFNRRLDLRVAARSLRRHRRQPGPGRHRLLRRADPHPALPPHRSLRADTQMSKRSNKSFWIAFGIVSAALILAPLVLPEFWRRFLTEILIWGLLAMSSDLLIGYTGMVSFGHSAFFGLGMYGAAAALLMVKPPNLWLAMLYGLVGSAAIALFVAYFSTRLRDIYFAITTLIFSQIFYVVVFTWTDVTGGENGLNFTRPQLGIPGIYTVPF